MRSRLGLFVLFGVLAATPVACERPQSSPPQSPDGPTTRTTRGSDPDVGAGQGAQARMAANVSGELIVLATVGDVMPGSREPLAPIPDGLGAHGAGVLTLHLSHELAGVRRITGGSDYRFARVSELVIDTTDLAVIRHRYVINGTEGYRRLCSGGWVDERDGFAGGYYFTGEEVPDGLQLAIDRQGTVVEMPWIGRYAHENQIAIPGFPAHAVVLNFEDHSGSGTGVSASLSELYMYVGRNGQEVLVGAGGLYVFAADAVAHPGRISVGQSIAGRWLRVPDATASDAAALERFGDENGAFPFVRLEDGFSDKRPGAAPAAYFFDTGSAGVRDESGSPWDPWGSIYRLEFNDPGDPTGAATLILLARSSGPAHGWASPDNGAMSRDGIVMLQEDPANQPWRRRPGIWQLRLTPHGRLADPIGRQVVEVVHPEQPDNAELVFGWETSGIIDVSEWFGGGTWLFDVQAHSMSVPRLGLGRENGQVLMLRLNES